jgi:hypothetical protein
LLDRHSNHNALEILKRDIRDARAALPHVAERDTPLGRWARGLPGRAHQNVVVVALANKLVRIAWAVLQRGQRFFTSWWP